MITTLQLEESKAIWNTIVRTESMVYPFYTYDWHLNWKNTLAFTSNVFVYHTDDVLISLVLMGNEAHFSGGEDIADYLDCLGQQGGKETFWRELLPYLKNNGVNKLMLSNVPNHSPTKDILVSLGAVAKVEDMTPTVKLPETTDAYLNSLDRKSRHEFNRKVKKFDLTYPNCTVVVTEVLDIALLLDLMKRNDAKKEFLTNNMETFFTTIPTLSDVKTLQANLIDNTGLIVASCIFFSVNKTLLLYNSGFNETFQGSGLYLKAKMMLWAINNGYKEYNFLQGQERYKYELGGKDVPVYQIAITL